MFCDFWFVLYGVSFFEVLYFRHVGRFLVGVGGRFCFIPIFPSSRYVVEDVFVVENVVMFFRLLHSAVLFMPYGAFVPIQYRYLRVARFRCVDYFTVLLTVSRVCFGLAIFRRMFVVLLARCVGSGVRPYGRGSQGRGYLKGHSSRGRGGRYGGGRCRARSSKRALFLS